MTDRVLGLLGMMRKASAIVPGEDRASEAVSQGKAKLLLLASDAGEKMETRAGRMLEGRSARRIVLPYTREEAGAAIGLGGCSMIAVTDLGFAESLMEKLAEQDPERYGAEAVGMKKPNAERQKSPAGRTGKNQQGRNKYGISGKIQDR